MAAQAQDRQAQDERERNADKHRTNLGEQNALLMPVLPQHGRRVGPQTKEHDVAKTHVAGVAADDIPAEAQGGEHQHATPEILVVSAMQQRYERQQNEERDRHTQRARVAGNTAHYAEALPSRPRGRRISTIRSTTRATASCSPVPMYCEPKASSTPKIKPPSNAPCTEPRPPRTHTTNAEMTNGSPIDGCRL